MASAVDPIPTVALAESVMPIDPGNPFVGYAEAVCALEILFRQYIWSVKGYYFSTLHHHLHGVHNHP